MEGSHDGSYVGRFAVIDPEPTTETSNHLSAVGQTVKVFSPCRSAASGIPRYRAMVAACAKFIRPLGLSRASPVTHPSTSEPSQRSNRVFGMTAAANASTASSSWAGQPNLRMIMLQRDATWFGNRSSHRRSDRDDRALSWSKSHPQEKDPRKLQLIA